jgi:hypothetical protein
MLQSLFTDIQGHYCWWACQLPMWDLMNFPIILRFYFIFSVMLKLDIQATHCFCSITMPPCASYCTVSCWIKCPHHLRLPEHPFYRTHMEMQHVWITSEVLPAQPFNCIPSCNTRVDLDHHSNSTAWTSKIYLEHCCCCWECSNLALFGTFYTPLVQFHLKTFFILTNWHHIASYHALQLEIIIHR